MRQGDWRVEARFETGRLEVGTPLWERETGDWRVEPRFGRGRLEVRTPL